MKFVAQVLVFSCMSQSLFAQRVEQGFSPDAIITGILQQFNQAEPQTFGLKDATINGTLVESRTFNQGIKFLVSGNGFSFAFDVTQLRFDEKGNLVADFFIDGKPAAKETVLIEALEARYQTSTLENLQTLAQTSLNPSRRDQSTREYINRTNEFGFLIQRRIGYTLERLWDEEAKEKGYLSNADLKEVREAFTTTAGVTILFTAILSVVSFATKEASILPQVALVSSLMLATFAMFNPFGLRIIKAIKAALSPRIRDEVSSAVADYVRRERPLIPGGPCVITSML